MAAHLAHEGTHAQWDRAPSIDQEYHARRAQAEVWLQLRGDERDQVSDDVARMMSLGEERAKAQIRRMSAYAGLPELG